MLYLNNLGLNFLTLQESMYNKNTKVMKSIQYICILSLIFIFTSCSTSKQLSYEDDVYSTETEIVFADNNSDDDYYDPYEDLYEDYDYFDDDNNTYITNNYYCGSRRYRNRYYRNYYAGFNYYPTTYHWSNSCCGMNYGYPYNGGTKKKI